MSSLAADGAESVHGCFARVARTRPTALAVSTRSMRLTYAELHRRAAGVAAAVAARSPDGSQPVAVMADDPVARIAAMLGVWTAGRPTVVIDAADPGPRVAAILRDAGADLILTDAGARRDLGCQVLDLSAIPGLDPGEVVPVSADHPFALVYTSGSSGIPKAVVRHHRHQLHRTRWMIRSLGLGPGDRMSSLHVPTTAVGLRDVVAGLLAGATVLPFDVRRAGLGELARWLDDEAVSVLCASATAFRHLVASVEPSRRFASVRAVRLGSEPAYRADVDAFRRHFLEEAVLVTGYGATEANGICEYRIGRDTALPSGRVPAGFPADGIELLVVDDAGRPLPVGEVGEVVVRSSFLSPGYWRQPDLTAAAFAENEGGETRRYRTGDIGRLDADGCLTVFGRRDEQVKVRGYRVHPDEIEAALRDHEAVREAVVVGRPDARGEIGLVAYVVPVGPGATDAVALRRFLRGRLPAHMVPAAFAILDALPALPSGKVDRAALPEPTGGLGAPACAYVRPRSPIEQRIAELWERLLGEAPVGGDHDFFDLGGNSLVAAAFVTELEATCGRAVPPSMLVEFPTVAGFADALVRDEVAAPRAVIPLRETGGRAPLFFLHGDHRGGGLYCHGLARRLDPGRPFYAVHPHGLGDRSVLPTIEAMAADLLPAIRAARPGGPYALAGYCSGGLVALELARRLRDAGERVERVVLVEAKPPDGLLPLVHRADAAAERLGLAPARRARLMARGERHVEALEEGARYYARRARAFARAPLAVKAQALGRLLGRGARGSATALGIELRAADPRGPTAQVALDAGKRDAIHEAYHRAIRRYRPPADPGLVAVIAALESAAHETALGWRAVLPRVVVTAVPGDHMTCLTRHVDALAEALDRALARG